MLSDADSVIRSLKQSVGFEKMLEGSQDWEIKRKCIEALDTSKYKDA